MMLILNKKENSLALLGTLQNAQHDRIQFFSDKISSKYLDTNLKKFRQLVIFMAPKNPNKFW